MASDTSSLTQIFALSNAAGQKLPAELNRRTLLKVGGSAGAGLILGFAVPMTGLGTAARAAAPGAGLAADPFVRIASDNTVTVIIKHLDKGQGAATGLATLVAEELDAGWAQIRTEFAPSDPIKYKNFAFGVQGVGGSTGLANSYDQYRQAGAAARAMIVAAAAREWGVNPETVAISNGVVSNGAGKTATLGALAEAAAREAVPSKVTLKTPDKWVYIGKTTFPRVDSKAKSDGTAKYTQDVQFDGLPVAVMLRAPKFGATLATLDSSAAEKMPGVVKVVKVPRGVAVVAKDTWSAISAREALKATWDESKAETRSTDEIIAAYREKLDKPGAVARADGDAEAALAKAAKVVTADFEFPYLAHAPMEPLNCVVKTDGAAAEIWTGSQLQTIDHATACAVLNLKPEAVQIHTLWAGGSFGRRAIADSHFVAEACSIAKAMGGPVAVKLVWTREDDIKGGYYRPLYVHRIRAGLDAGGKVVAWHHRIVGQSILAGTPFAAQMVKNGIDASSVEGAASLPYAIANLTVELHTMASPVPVLWWRSVGSTHTAHATEHMINLLAKEAGADPVQFRLELLKDKPRHAGALKLAAEKAGWGKPVPAGVTRGVAVHESFKSFVAQVADVTLQASGDFKVTRVVNAIDCGIAVNPDVVAAQMEGGIGYGLGAALRDEITLAKGGEVEQANFDSYMPLRMSDMPMVECHIVPSAEAPSGVGEPGTPVALPAVANALYAATGVKTLKLPMTKQTYKSAKGEPPRRA